MRDPWGQKRLALQAQIAELPEEERKVRLFLSLEISYCGAQFASFVSFSCLLITNAHQLRAHITKHTQDHPFVPHPNPRVFPTQTPGDAHLSYLPLAHIYERAIVRVSLLDAAIVFLCPQLHLAIQCILSSVFQSFHAPTHEHTQVEACLATGAAIGCWQNDVAKVQDDAAALKPVIMVRLVCVCSSIMDTGLRMAATSRVLSVPVLWSEINLLLICLVLRQSCQSLLIIHSETQVGVPRVFERIKAGVQKKLAARTPIARSVRSEAQGKETRCLNVVP